MEDKKPCVEDKNLRRSKMYKVSLLVILSLMTLMLVFLNSRMNALEMDHGILNDNVKTVDNGITTLNNNILATNYNLNVLQDNLYGKINATCS